MRTQQTCPITVHDPIPPAYNGGRGERMTKPRPCGAPDREDS